MRPNRVLAGMMVAAASAVMATGAVAQPRIASLEIKGAPRERPPELAWLFGGDSPTLRQLVDAIEGSADASHDALLIRLRDAELSRTQVEELGQAIARAREAGRKVVVFSDAMGPAELALGSYADKSIVQAGGGVSLPGLYMEEMFLADTLNWIGVKADMVQVGDYKGAAEMLVNTGPSPAWNQNIDQLLDSLYGNLRQELTQGRAISPTQLDKAMAKLWMGTAEDAVEAGLVDEAVDLPALGQAITGERNARWTKLKPVPESSLKMDEGNPFAAMSQMMSIFTKKPPTKATKPTIALLHIDGQIIDGESAEGGFGGGTSVGSRTIRNAIEDIRGQELIKGVVVRINSPGGSAIASEIMWQGLRRLAEKKPVWVSVGSMAASGGYYLAVAGDRIYVNPSSIVGSIGVVGGKFSLGGLYEHLKINVVGRARGPAAAMFDTTRPWTDDQRRVVRAKMQETYDLFTKRVKQGREGIDLALTAEGRLFTGDRAVELKMADEVGSLEDAIGDLAEEVGLDEFATMDFPAPRPLDEVLEDAFKGFGLAAPAARASAHGVPSQLVAGLRAAVGERAWPQVARALDAIMVLRDEPVGLVMPRALIFR